MRRRVSRALRRVADRVDPTDAPKATGFRLHYEAHVGAVMTPSNVSGRMLWWLNDDDADDAWPPLVNGRPRPITAKRSW